MRLRVHSVLEQGLGVVKLVALIIWVEFGELVIHLAGLLIVLDIEVTVGEERQRGPAAGCKLQLVGQDSYNL